MIKQKLLIIVCTLALFGCTQKATEVDNTKEITYISYKVYGNFVEEWTPVGNPNYTCVKILRGVDCFPKERIDDKD